MDSGNVMRWEFSIPGWVMVRGTIMLFVRAILACWIIAEIVTWFNRASATVYVVRAIQKGEVEFFFAAGFARIVVIVSVVTVAIMYAGGYRAIFTLTDEGAVAATALGQHKQNESVRTALDVMSLATGKPQGMAMSYASRVNETASLSWKNLRKVVPNRRKFRIALKNSWRTVIVLYCTPENYARALAIVESHLPTALVPVTATDAAG